MNSFPDRKLTTAVGFFMFLLGASVFVTKSGHSLGPVLLLLTSVVLLFPSYRKQLHLDRETWFLIIVLFFFALVWAGGYWADIEPQSRAFDKPSRVILAIPVLLLLLVIKPSPAWLAVGLLVGAFCAGVIGVYEKLVLGANRASGPLHAIQFGNLSMLWGVLCGVVFIYLAKRKDMWPWHNFWLLLFFIAVIMGVLGSLLSGSRGGWIGLPFVLLVFWKAYSNYFSWRVKCSFLGLLLVAGLVVWFTPQMGVQERVRLGIEQFNDYVFVNKNRDTSVGQRLQMWENSFVMAAEKPLIGWGEQGYREYLFAASDEGRLTRGIQHQHAHNQFFDMLAKHGIPGFFAVLAFFFVPLVLFGRYMKHEDPRLKALAVGGTLLCVSFIDFGLTQAIIWHTGGIMVYTFLLVILWALLKNRRNVVGEE